MRHSSSSHTSNVFRREEGEATSVQPPRVPAVKAAEGSSVGDGKSSVKLFYKKRIARERRDLVSCCREPG